MKDYKRLTERDVFGNADIIDLSTEKLYSELCFAETNLLTKALNRLAELEDKIENGTLVELPCKVGDKIYVCYGVCVDEWEVVSIQIYGYDILFRLGHKGTDDYNSQYLIELGETWFLTKAEAENKLATYQKQLRELKGERQ